MFRILIVEDDAAIAVALEDDLTLEGYEVCVVSDGPGAVATGRSGRFDLILLDVMLPGKDGFDVCRELRRAGVASMILMLTARTQDAEKIMGLDLGADDYLTKPYNPKELRARIRALLRRGAQPATAAGKAVSFGECIVDLERGELRRGGRPVDTTPTEFRLLTLFTSRPGRVFTRRQLLDEVWGRDVFTTERVVDNQVANLRKKVERDPAQPEFLVSVRGIGYRFDLEPVTES